jgi:CobQ/CobB/MinD/ParA nucleotide binding domain
MKEGSGMGATNGSGRIYWIGGSKGGVGKSMMTLAMLDHLLGQGTKALLVECDTSNPDVWKAYKEQVEAELIDLDEADGWIHFVNLCEQHREEVVVVNTAARNNVAVKHYGQTLDSSLEEVGSQLVALWMINRQRDSLELLKEFMEAVPKAVVHVVRNGYFGEERKFELYNASKIRSDVESRGGKSITLPDLADRVADDLYVKRLSLSVAARSLPIGNRAELARWRGEVRRVLAEVVL